MRSGGGLRLSHRGGRGWSAGFAAAANKRPCGHRTRRRDVVPRGWRASGPCSTGDKDPSAGHERHPVEGFRCNAATQLDVTALKGIERPRTAAQFARLPNGSPVDDPEDPAELAIVRMPAEIDITNAAHVGDELAAVLTPGVVAIIADMTATTFCGSSAITMLLRTHLQATREQCRTAAGDLIRARPAGPWQSLQRTARCRSTRALRRH